LLLFVSSLPKVGGLFFGFNYLRARNARAAKLLLLLLLPAITASSFTAANEQGCGLPRK
jgi:hypothetical protein